MEILIKRPYFKKIYLGIMPVLVSLLVISLFIACWQNMRNRKQIEENEYNREAGRIILQVDDQFSQIYELTSGLMNREWVKRLYSPSEVMREYFDYTRNKEIYQEMNIYNSWVEYTKTIAVLDMNRNSVVDKNGWQEYAAFCRGLGITEEDQQKELFDMMERGEGLLTVMAPGWEDRFGNELCFISREIGLTPSSKCFFLAVFDKKNFQLWLLELNPDITYFQMSGEEAELLSAWMQKPEKGENIFSSQSRFGWNYSIVVNGFGKEGFGIREVVACSGILIFAAAVGALLSFWLTWVLYHPMLALLKKLRLQGIGEEDEYSIILSHVELLNREKEAARQETQQYYRIARNAFLQKILYGYFDKRDLMKEQKKYQLDLSDDRWYQVVRVYMQEESEILVLRKAAEDYLKLKKLAFEIVESFRQEMFIILILNSMEEQMGKKELAEFMDNLKALTDRRINLLGGTCEQKTIGISKSYSNIHEICLADKEDGAHGKARIADVKQKIYYPTDWEIQLITQLKYGNSGVVNEILSELDKENHARDLGREERRKITAVIFDTFVRVMEELDIRDNDLILEYHHYRRSQDDDEQWRLLYEMANMICTGVWQKTERAKTSETMKQIREYVDNHFSDPQLSLKQIGEEFSMSESSVSRLFKNHFREMFADYVCRLRMEKAKEYLRAGRYTVKVVAGMVGYNNELSFSRAFQKYEGIRPSIYAELSRTKEKGEEQDEDNHYQ